MTFKLIYIYMTIKIQGWEDLGEKIIDRGDSQWKYLKASVLKVKRRITVSTVLNILENSGKIREKEQFDLAM